MGILANPKHEAFCQRRLEGMTQEAAYIAVGYKPSRPHAHKLSIRPDVVQRMKELHIGALAKTEVTVETIAEQLDADREFAIKCKVPSAAVAATVAKAKLYGLAVDRSVVAVTHNYSSMSEEELKFEIAALLAEARSIKPGVQH